MSGEGIKVTDKRMFTEKGELREEYQQFDSTSAPARDGSDLQAAGEESAGGDAGAERRSSGTMESVEVPGESPATAIDREEAERERPAPSAASSGKLPGDGFGPPQFLDLVGVLAEPATVFLGDATLPDGTSMEDLPRARLYIDLLDLLRQRTQGRLETSEGQVLDDLIYRLRLRYVEKSKK